LQKIGHFYILFNLLIPYACSSAHSYIIGILKCLHFGCERFFPEKQGLQFFSCISFKFCFFIKFGNQKQFLIYSVRHKVRIGFWYKNCIFTGCKNIVWIL